MSCLRRVGARLRRRLPSSRGPQTAARGALGPRPRRPRARPTSRRDRPHDARRTGDRASPGQRRSPPAEGGVCPGIAAHRLTSRSLRSASVEAHPVTSATRLDPTCARHKGQRSTSTRLSNEQQALAELVSPVRIPEQNVRVPRQLLGLLGRDASGSELVERHVGCQQLVNDLARHADGLHPGPDGSEAARGAPALLLLARRATAVARAGRAAPRRTPGRSAARRPLRPAWPSRAPPAKPRRR